MHVLKVSEDDAVMAILLYEESITARVGMLNFVIHSYQDISLVYFYVYDFNVFFTRIMLSDLNVYILHYTWVSLRLFCSWSESTASF